MVHLKNKQQPKKKNADKMSKNTLFLRVKSILKSSMQNVNSLSILDIITWWQNYE